MGLNRSQLGDLERAVMDVLWSQPASSTSTVRDVYEHLLSDREIAYTTVMTVMDRLARKELVVQVKDGRAYRYAARMDRASLTAELMRDALDDVSETDRGSALVAFVGSAAPADLEALRAALVSVEAASETGR